MGKELSYYGAIRDDITGYIPPGAVRILDVGCGIGLMGGAIKKARGSAVEVIGIEKEPNVADMARSNIDKVVCGDVEKLDLPYEKGYFDCIVYGDILEHLVDPLGLLIKHRPFLKEGGYVIASIPNVAHYRVIKMLRKKEWQYQSTGVLDETHIRFFTVKSIKRMFDKANLAITRIGNKISGSKVKKTLNKIFFNALADYLSEQYIVVAQKKTPDGQKTQR